MMFRFVRQCFMEPGIAIRSELSSADPTRIRPHHPPVLPSGQF